jgi:hypothetical protein
LKLENEVKVYDKKLKEYKDLFSSKRNVPSKGEIAAPSTGNDRVREPIPGVYDSIPLSKTKAPAGWSIAEEEIIEVSPNVWKITNTVIGPNGKEGYYIRIYDQKKKHLVMSHAFQDTDLPSRIDSVPFANGKGVPTVAYWTMYQMKKLGAAFGDVNTVQMKQIQNVLTIIELEGLRRQGMDINDALLKTASVRYGETGIIQSGHQITGARFDPGRFDKIDWLIDNHISTGVVKKSDVDAMLLKYGLTKYDKMNYDFSIYLDLAPLPYGQTAKPN